MIRDKEKFFIAGFSVLFHLGLLSAFSLTDILHSPIIAVNDKKPCKSVYIPAFPVSNTGNAPDAETEKDRDEKREPSHVRVADLNNSIIEDSRFPTLNENHSLPEKKTIHPILAGKNKTRPDPNVVRVFYSPQTPSPAVSAADRASRREYASTPVPSRAKAASPAIAAAASAESGKIDDLSQYKKIIRDKIYRHLIYPWPAKKRAIEGTVQIRFLISKDGHLKDVKLAMSSNYKILDRAAIETINQSHPFLPLPESLKKDELWLSLAMSFNLDR
jgi:protein TonB